MLRNAEISRPNLLDFTLEEMENFIIGLGKEKFRARQVMKWLHQKNVSSFEEMTTLSRDFRDKLGQISCWNNFSFEMQLWIDKENRFAYKRTSPKQLQILFLKKASPVFRSQHLNCP